MRVFNYTLQELSVGDYVELFSGQKGCITEISDSDFSIECDSGIRTGNISALQIKSLYSENRKRYLPFLSAINIVIALLIISVLLYVLAILVFSPDIDINKYLTVYSFSDISGNSAEICVNRSTMDIDEDAFAWFSDSEYVLYPNQGTELPDEKTVYDFMTSKGKNKFIVAVYDNGIIAIENDNDSYTLYTVFADGFSAFEKIKLKLKALAEGIRLPD